MFRRIDIVRVLIGLAMLSFTGADGCEGLRSSVIAEGEAKTYLDAMAIKIEGRAVCADRDSDGDGYVSCSYRQVDAREPSAILCSYYRGGGCKKAPEQVIAPGRRRSGSVRGWPTGVESDE